MTPVETPPAVELIKLAPSSIKYIFDRCKRCFWLKCRGITHQEKGEFGLASEVDRSMKAHFTPDALRELGIPAVSILPRSKVTSRIIETAPGVGITIAGYPDCVAELESGSFAPIDYKLTTPKRKGDRHPFADQVAAYATALEQPESGDSRHVECAYVVSFTPGPSPFHVATDRRNCAIRGQITVERIEIDRSYFLNRLDEIAALAALHEMPDAGQWCETCRHIDRIVEMRAQGGPWL